MPPEWNTFKAVFNLINTCFRIASVRCFCEGRLECWMSVGVFSKWNVRIAQIGFGAHNGGVTCDKGLSGLVCVASLESTLLGEGL